LVSCS